MNRSIVAWGLVWLAATAANAYDVPAEQPGEGKGTIGLVCVDDAGAVHLWNSTVKVEADASTRDNALKTDFDVCVDHVVSGLILRNSSPTPRAGDTVATPGPVAEDWIQGIAGYRKSVLRAQALQAKAKE